MTRTAGVLSRQMRGEPRSTTGGLASTVAPAVRHDASGGTQRIELRHIRDKVGNALLFPPTLHLLGDDLQLNERGLKAHLICDIEFSHGMRLGHSLSVAGILRCQAGWEGAGGPQNTDAYAPTESDGD